MFSVLFDGRKKERFHKKGIFFKNKKTCWHCQQVKKRMTGIEPASKAWEAFILPMNYIRKVHG
jgi:hypothetical protein